MDNNCRQIHETFTKEIIDAIDGIKDFKKIDWLSRKGNVGSIAKRASNLVLVFPAIVSSSNNIQSSMIAVKALERKCASLLQILFSAAQVTNVDNLQDYVNKFHTNLGLKNGIVDLDDFINIMDRLVEENTITITNKDVYEAVMEDMKNINFTLSETFNPTSINDYKLKRNMYGESGVVLEKLYDGDKNNDIIPNIKDSTNYLSNQLLANDIKKANELMPTTMMVNFTMYDDDTGSTVSSTGVIGVKVKMYPVESTEIINRISSKVKDSRGLFNLVRASTREISFFKDLAFAIDKTKLDAVNVAKDSSNAKIFKLLERRASKNKFSTLLKKNDASPITSLILSETDVEYLKKYNDIDMEKSYIARTILEAYNLMDIVVLDESLELAKFLYDDGDGVYETLTFDSLEKEANDNSYKKVINLMSKMNR